MAKNINLPTVSTPSLSIPKPSTPKVYHVLPSTPFKMGYTPAERRHVKDFGDIVLGNPITGTRQLRETLEDNNAANLIGNPVISRLAGFKYWAKERILDPFKSDPFGKALIKVGINGLESFGYTLDTLANPIKSLMPWAGGGKDGDFLRSMGWLDDEYRETYQWDTGHFLVDFAGEIISDPANLIKIPGGTLTKIGGALWDEGAMTVRNAIRTRWGDVVADNIPNSVINDIIQHLKGDISDANSEILDAFNTYIRQRADDSRFLYSNTPTGKQAVWYKENILDPYTKVLDLRQQDEFIKDLLIIKESNWYKTYDAIKSAVNVAEAVDNSLLYIGLGMNPLLSGNLLMFKKLSPALKDMWGRYVSAKEKINLDLYFNNSPAEVRRLQRAVSTKNIVRKNAAYSQFKRYFDTYGINENTLQKQYVKILSELPENKRTLNIVNDAFLEWLKKAIPDLADVIDLMNDPKLLELVNSLHDEVVLAPAVLEEINKYIEIFGDGVVEVEDIKNLVNLVDAVSEAGVTNYGIAVEAEAQRIQEIEEAINDWFTKKENLDAYPIINHLDFIEENLLNYHGVHYGFERLNELLDMLWDQDKEYYEELIERLSILGFTNIDNSQTMINAYFKYKKTGDTAYIKVLKRHMSQALTGRTYTNSESIKIKPNKNIKPTNYEQDPMYLYTRKKIESLNTTIPKTAEETYAAILDLFKSYGFSDEYDSRLLALNVEIETVLKKIKSYPANQAPKALYKKLKNLRNTRASFLNNNLFGAMDVNTLLKTLDEFDTYDGGDVLYKDATSWTSTFNSLKKAVNRHNVLEYKEVLEQLEYNVDRFYARITNAGLNKEFYTMLNKENLAGLILGLKEILSKTRKQIIPQVLEASNASRTLYVLQSKYMNNFNTLSTLLEAFYETVNTSFWKEYTNPESPLRQNLQRVALMFSEYNGNIEGAGDFSKDINEILSVLDSHQALVDLINSTQVMTRFELNEVLNNALTDRIYDLIFNLQKTSIYEFQQTKNKIISEFIDNLDTSLLINIDSEAIKKWDFRLELINNNADWYNAYLDRLELFNTGNLAIKPKDIVETFFDQFKVGLKEQLDLYIEKIIKAQALNERIHIGSSLLTNNVVPYMNDLGMFEANVIDILSEMKNIETTDVQQVTDFIRSVTGYYTADELMEIKETIQRKYYNKELSDTWEKVTTDYDDVNFKEEIQEIIDTVAIPLENRLARVITESFNYIGNMNKDLQGVSGYAGLVKTSTGQYKALKNITGYLTKHEINTILLDAVGEHNLFSYSVYSGMLGFKKEIDGDLIYLHNLQAQNFNFSRELNSLADTYYVQFYHNFVNTLSYVEKFPVENVSFAEPLRQTLINFAKKYGKDYMWFPKEPGVYFRNASIKDLRTWDLLITSGAMDNILTYYNKPLKTRVASQYNKIKNLERTAFLKYQNYKELYFKRFVTRNKNKYPKHLLDMYYNATLGAEIYSRAERKLMKGLHLSDQDRQELLKSMPLDYIDALNELFTRDLEMYSKSPAMLKSNRARFETYISKNLQAHHNTRPLVDLSLDKRTIDKVIDYNKLSAYEQDLLKSAGVTPKSQVRHQSVQNYLKKERVRTCASNIRNFSAHDLRVFIDENENDFLVFVNRGSKFKWSAKALKEAGLTMAELPDSNGIFIIRKLTKDRIQGNIKYTLYKSPLAPLQKIVTDSFANNRNYLNIKGSHIPNELLTGDYVSSHVYNAFINDSRVQTILGDIEKQKVYSNLDDKGYNKIYTGDYAKPNLVFIGDESSAYNEVLNYIKDTLDKRKIAPDYKSPRLDSSAYMGSNLAIKRVDKKDKWLQLWFNDDFYLGNQMFKRGFDKATDADIQALFERHNYVSCILREDRQGNPKVYRIHIRNKEQLKDAIDAGAIMIPYDSYSTMVTAINHNLLEDKIINAYNRYIVGTFKTMYLSSIGFLLRNGLDSLVYKNAATTEGIPSILDNFKYEKKAMDMLELYNKIYKETLELSLITRHEETFNIELLNQVLQNYSKDEQLIYRLTDRFLHSKAASGVAEATKDYYLKRNMKEAIDTGKNWLDYVNEDIIHGAHSPFTIINNANSSIEQTARFGLFLNLVENGTDYSDAIRKVIDTHFNYELTGTPLELIEQVFWFSTFPINNFNYYINNGLTKNPELLKAQLDLLELSYNSDDLTWENVKNSNYLSYNALVGNIRIKIFGKNIIIKTGSSVLDFYNTLYRPITEVKEHLNPIMSVLLGFEDIKELNPFTTAWNRGKTFINKKSFIPSVYAPLYERQQYSRLPRTKYSYSYNKSKWNFKPRKSYFKNPDNMRKMKYKFTTYRYYFNRGKNYRRWLQSTTSIEPYWYNENYKRLRSSRFRKYKQQIRKL